MVCKTGSKAIKTALAHMFSLCSMLITLLQDAFCRLAPKLPLRPSRHWYTGKQKCHTLWSKIYFIIFLQKIALYKFNTLSSRHVTRIHETINFRVLSISNCPKEMLVVMCMNLYCIAARSEVNAVRKANISHVCSTGKVSKHSPRYRT